MKAFLLGALVLVSAPLPAAKPDAVVVAHAWARATPPGARVGAAYFTIENPGKADVLLAIASPAAARAELHRTTLENGMSRMRPAGEVVIAAGATVKVEPGGLHVMLMDLKAPLVAGTTVPLQLTFRNAGTVTVQAEVQAMGITMPMPMPAGHTGRAAQ